MEDLRLPDTDSAEVMQQAVSLQLALIIWDQYSRGVHPDQFEESILELYQRVFKAVSSAHA